MEETTVRDRLRTHTKNLTLGFRQAGVKRVFLNSVRVGAVNALATGTSEILNYYLESKGLNSRRIAVMAVPNPDRGHSENPLKARM